MSNEEEENNNNDDLGDWRAFRRKLTEMESSKERPQSVSQRNEELLASQNEVLVEEYRSGVWAHSIPEPEVGGLLCRLPLEVELWRLGSATKLGKRLSNSFPVNADIKTRYESSQELIKKLLSEFSHLVASGNGQIDVSKLSPELKEFFYIYIDYEKSWQEVSLVLSSNKTETTSVVLNRPMAAKLNKNLASLILSGNSKTKTGDLVRFLTAFENNCALYVGGPQQSYTQPALFLHGLKELPGATEISPGTGVYTGGLDAAINGVLSGQYKPLDFRFFLGSYTFVTSHLLRDISLAKYQPIACARSIVLKQCIGLPKPLWHEVFELCGEEYKEISSLELKKRRDIQPDD